MLNNQLIRCNSESKKQGFPFRAKCHAFGFAQMKWDGRYSATHCVQGNVFGEDAMTHISVYEFSFKSGS